jgi:hypothetical protein
MKNIIILISALLTFALSYGQIDTLQSDEIEFKIIGYESGQIENYSFKIPILVRRTDLTKVPNELIFIHARNNWRIFDATLKLNPTKLKDTINFSYPGWVFPHDKFYLVYGSKRMEYVIISTVHSNDFPYYMDFKFVFNGDTIKSDAYEVFSFQNSIVDETTIRVSDFKMQKEIRVKYRGQVIRIDLLKGDEIMPIFHGLTILCYVDNLKKISENEKYIKHVKFAMDNKCKTITFFEESDLDFSRKHHGITCVDRH